MYRFKTCLLLCLLIGSIFSHKKPGLVLSMKHKLLDDLKLKFLPGIIKNISEQNLPDFYFKTNVLFLGDIIVVIKNFHLSLNSIFPEKIQTNLKEPNRIVASVRGPNGKLTGNAEIKTKGLLPITINSEILAEVKNINVDVEASIGRTENPVIPNRMGPSVKVQSINFIGDLDINVTLLKSSIANNIVNTLTQAFVSIFKGLVKDIVTSIIQTIATNEIPKNLHQIPLFQDIPFTGLVVDNSLTNDPYIKEDALIVSVDASIYEKENINQSIPIPSPIDIQPIVQNEKLLQIIFTDYIFNSFSYSFFKSGKLSNIIINPRIFNKIDLNVLTFSIFWPRLLLKYKFNRAVKFDCGCLSYPIFNIKEGNLEVESDIGCDMIVKNVEGEDDVAFKVKMKIFFAAYLLVDKGKIKIQINSAKLSEFTTLESSIGDFSMKNLQRAINFILKIGKPIANYFLNKTEIPIPSLLDINLNDAEILLQEKYVKIQISPVFSPIVLMTKEYSSNEFNEIFQKNLKMLIEMDKSENPTTNKRLYWVK